MTETEQKNCPFLAVFPFFFSKPSNFVLFSALSQSIFEILVNGSGIYSSRRFFWDTKMRKGIRREHYKGVHFFLKSSLARKTTSNQKLKKTRRPYNISSHRNSNVLKQYRYMYGFTGPLYKSSVQQHKYLHNTLHGIIHSYSTILIKKISRHVANIYAKDRKRGQ